MPQIQDNDAFDNPGQGLYIWTTKPHLGDKNPPLKFGQYGALAKSNTKTPDSTINSYVGATLDTIVILYVIRLDDYLKSSKNINGFVNAYQIEQLVGKLIIKNGGYHETYGKSTEVFGGLSLENTIKIINSVLYNVKKLKDFEMRPEQKEAHDKIVEYFKTHKGLSIKPAEFLLAAKMRYGKNFTFLNVAKTMGMKNVLVLTYKPHVFQSLKDDIDDHVLFDGWKFVAFKDQRNIAASTTTCQVIVSSAQLAQYKSDDPSQIASESIKKIRKNIQALSKIPFDMVVADEYHYGTSTANFKEVLKSLKYDHIIYVSGTAMKDIAAGRFEDEQIYTYDYIDEQKKKRAGSKAHKDMPTMEFHLMHIDERAKAIGDWYTPEEGFNMAKLITVENGHLKNQGSLQLLLSQVIGTGVHNQMSPYRLVAGLDHTLWVFDKNVKGIKATAALMRKMPEYKNFDIIEATGNVVTDINEVIERINKAEDNKKRTITLTCYRFKEGVTIPQWNGVIMLDQGKSVEEYLQAIFRAQSPNKEKGKDKCYVFDFNPQRCLQMIYDTCENIDKTGKRSLRETIREFLENANILDHYGNKLNNVDFNKVIENFREHGSFAEKFANLKNVNVDKLDSEIINTLTGIQGGKRKKEIEINDQDVQTGKTALSKRGAGAEGESDETDVKKSSKDQIKKYLQKIATVLSNIPEYLFNSQENEQKVDDILQGKDPELFKEITGISIEDFKEWNDKKLLNTVLINRNILNFYDAEKKFLESNPSLEDKDKFFNQHFNMRAEGGPTPSALVNEMLDKLEEYAPNIFSDPKKTFCDPVMGTGTFLIAIKERLMEGLKKAIPDEAKREEHIINNMLFGSDINQSKVNIAKKLLGNSNHINKEDSLTKNWNMKFDVVVGNPPFQNITATTQKGKKIWPKFVMLLKDIVKENGIYAYVVPLAWIRGEKTYSGVSRPTPASLREDFFSKQNLLYVNIDTISHYFKVGESFSYFIGKNEKYQNKTIVENKNGTMEINYEELPFIPTNLDDISLNIYNKTIWSNLPKIDLLHGSGYKSRVLSDEKTKMAIYPVTTTSSNYSKKIYKWAEKPWNHQFVKKVIFSDSGYANPFYDEGKYGIGEHSLGIKVENKKQADNLMFYLNDSKLSKFLEKSIPSGQSSGFAYIVWWMPKINLNSDISDDKLYEHFGLTEYKDYIESQIKFTK